MGRRKNRNRNVKTMNHKSDSNINVLHGLLVKMNLPKEERNNVIKNLKENSDMGILFADLKGMDIQAVRRESNKVREELKDTKKKYNQAQAEKEQAQAQAEQFRVQLEYTMKENEEMKKYAKDTIDTSMVNYINKCKEEGKSRESTLEGLAFIFSKDVEQADMILSMYWGD